MRRMRSHPALLLGVMTSVSVLWNAPAAAVSYEMSFASLPSEQGWSSEPNGVQESSVYSVDGSSTFTQDAIGLGQFEAPFYNRSSPLDPSLPFVFELDANLLQSEGSDGFGFSGSTDTEYFAMFLSSGEIRGGDDQTVSFNTSGFNKYRLVATPGVNHTISVDDQVVLTGSTDLPQNQVPSAFAFGDTPEGNLEIAIERFSIIPETAVAQLLGGGLLAMALRRRRNTRAS